MCVYMCVCVCVCVCMCVCICECKLCLAMCIHMFGIFSTCIGLAKLLVSMTCVLS